MLNELKSLFSKPLFLTAVMLIVGIVPAFFVGENTTAVLTKIAIMALFATSLNLQLGYGSMPALGQVMYFGMGAYGLTLLVTRAGFMLAPSFFLTMIAGIVVAMFLGFICLRSGTMFGFIFLNNGIALLIWSFVNKWMWIGADGGLLNTPRPSFAEGTTAFHIFTIIVVAICIFLLYLIRLSPFTDMLKGSRENPERLLFLGVSVRTVRWVAHVISAVFTVVAGMLFAMRNFGAYPTYLSNLLSTEMLISCVIGGMFNFMGPVLGAAIVTTINTVVSNITIYYQLILGLIIMFSVFFLKQGMLPGPENKQHSLLRGLESLKGYFATGKDY